MASLSKKILIVDDDQALVSSLSAGLTDEGYQVAAAYSENSALSVFTQENPDLVILDLMLPGIDGISVCRMIRRNSPVPIIMLTAKKDDIDKIIGLEIGADEYITKPFNFRVLLAQVKSALRRPNMEGYDSFAESGMLTFGSLLIDLSKREVHIDRKPIVLSLKEYELLVIMAQNPGRVFERGELLSRVWGDDFFGDDKTLDVHIFRLRAKIEPDPGNPKYIHTVRGVGYKLASL